MTTVAILDYGMGNVRSVSKAFEHIGAGAVLTSDPEAAAGADGLVLPGVRAVPQDRGTGRARGLDRLISERIAAGVPVLGICLGYQLLYDSSTELGGADRPRLPSGPVTGP